MLHNNNNNSKSKLNSNIYIITIIYLFIFSFKRLQLGSGSSELVGFGLSLVASQGQVHVSFTHLSFFWDYGLLKICSYGNSRRERRVSTKLQWFLRLGTKVAHCSFYSHHTDQTLVGRNACIFSAFSRRNCKVIWKKAEIQGLVMNQDKR